MIQTVEHQNNIELHYKILTSLPKFSVQSAVKQPLSPSHAALLS